MDPKFLPNEQAPGLQNWEIEELDKQSAKIAQYTALKQKQAIAAYETRLLSEELAAAAAEFGLTPDDVPARLTAKSEEEAKRLDAIRRKHIRGALREGMVSLDPDLIKKRKEMVPEQTPEGRFTGRKVPMEESRKPARYGDDGAAYAKMREVLKGTGLLGE